MGLLRAAALTAAAVMAAFALKRAIGEFSLAGARIDDSPEPEPVRLRQDPRTGVYYPDA